MYNLILHSNGPGVRSIKKRQIRKYALIALIFFLSVLRPNPYYSMNEAFGKYDKDALLIEHDLFNRGGILLAMNSNGEITSKQEVTTSPVEVDVTNWNSGKYVLVFRSENYNSIVAAVDIP